MFRRARWLVGLGVAVLLIPSLHADVKTREKSTIKLEGMLGRMSRMFGGTDPVTSSIALKGSRKISLGENNGEIVDLAAEKVYRIDVRRKEYKVLTFADIRKEWQETQAKAKESAEELEKTQREAGESAPKKELEFTADIKETGQQKSIAGHNTREVILTITGQEKGKTLEDGGGIVVTTTMWLAPRIAALDELTQFDFRYMKAIMGEEGAAQLQQLAAAFALYPAILPAMQRMQAEGTKLQGTALVTTTVFETVKSAAEMKAATPDRSGGGGGLGGRLAGRLMGGRGQASGPRSTVFTTTRELLSVDTSASEADVAIPAGFKEKK